MTTPFIRPPEWPQGRIADDVRECPACGSFVDVEVQARAYVVISAADYTNIDGVYDYDQASPARCGSCCYRDDLAAFTAIPADLSTPGSLLFAWQNSAGEPAGSATWERVPADQLNETLRRMKQYWPGIMVTVEGGPGGVSISTDPLWAPSVPTLADQVVANLTDTLGEPDTVT